MKIRFSIMFWHIFCANLCWALACGGAMWYAFREMDQLYPPFLIFYLFIGWFIGIISGMTIRGR